ncbi:MAG: MFS transporter [Acidobacteria bacterium]|nr:MFS transporter [Acidobacteriota bacterium]
MVGVVLAGISAISFPITVLSASLPTIADDLNTSDATITWVIVAPLVLFTGLTPIAGKLGDLYGHRRAFLVGYSVFTVLSLLTSLAWNVGALIAMRTLTQAFGAVAGPAGTAIMLKEFEPKERAKPLGYFAAVTALSPAVGVILGGPLVDAVGWRTLFVIQAGIAAIGLLATFIALPEDRTTTDVRFDLAGAATLASGIGVMLFSINRAGAWSLSNPVVWLSALAAGLLLWWFVRIEKRCAEPLMPLEFIRMPSIYRPVLAQTLMQAAYMGALVITPFFLTRVYDYNSTVIGLMVSPRALAFAAAAAIAGRIDQRFGGRTIVISAIGLVAVANVISSIGAALPAIGIVLIGAALSGFGNGGSRPSITASISNSVSNDQLGVASGALNMATQIGAATGITVFTAVIGESSSPTRWFWVFMLAAGVALVALVIAFTIPQSFGGQSNETTALGPGGRT